MSKNTILLTLIAVPALALTVTGCGKKEETPAPAGSTDTAAIPPPVSSREGEAQLPPGHPPMPGADAQLPSGHPPVEGMGAPPEITPPPAGSGEGATGLAWTLPKGWTEEPPANAMRKAQYKVPGPGGDGECVVFYFGPGQGGAPQANAERWASQFTLADGQPGTSGMKTGSMKVGDVEVLTVEVAGTYSAGSSMGMAPSEPKPGYKLLGAVAEGADANWFFKFTGPEKTVEANRAAFEGMLKSLKRGA
ncbi:MAG TPA: hypothetical protein VF139_07285 [Candidatus Polarisedimenticolaceae bacterium]